jgi:ribonuclease P protein subunit RPR2
VRRGTFIKKKQAEQAGALQKIRALFDAAALAFPADPARSHALAAQAHRLLLRSKAKLPVILKRRYCKYCRAFWVPGRTVRVRLGKGNIVYTCLACRRIRRMPLG